MTPFQTGNLFLILFLTSTLLLAQTQRREVFLEYKLRKNKQNLSDVQEGLKQAAAEHTVALHESKTELR